MLAEAKRLVASGTRELTLLGQNVNAYNGDAENDKSWNLARLLFALAEIDGLERLRYTTSHPLDMDDELINAHRDLPQLMPYLHLPVQSGSNAVLDAMNRRHERDAYFEIIDKLRVARPILHFQVTLSSAFPVKVTRILPIRLDWLTALVMPRHTHSNTALVRAHRRQVMIVRCLNR